MRMTIDHDDHYINIVAVKLCYFEGSRGLTCLSILPRSPRRPYGHRGHSGQNRRKYNENP